MALPLTPVRSRGAEAGTHRDDLGEWGREHIEIERGQLRDDDGGDRRAHHARVIHAKHAAAAYSRPQTRGFSF